MTLHFLRTPTPRRAQIVHQHDQRFSPTFLVFDGKELTDDETRALLTEGVREEITEAINRITGRVN